MGRYDLNLTEDDFWGLTIRELNALFERHKSNYDWLNYRAALICAIIANSVRDSKRKPRPYSPDNFMPRKEHVGQTPEQIFATIQMLNAAFGGSVSEE